MRVRSLTAAFVAVSAFAATPAVGQARIVPIATVIGDFGACTARQLPDRSRALMATPIGSRAERTTASRMAMSRDGCVPRHFDFIPMLTGQFRGAVAEALIENDPGAVARLRAMPSRPAVRADPAEGRAFVAAYARCIADADPARAVRLLETPPGAPPNEQRDHFLAYGDLLNDCMPMGAVFRIEPFDVRNHMAMRLYDLAFPQAAARAE